MTVQVQEEARGRGTVQLVPHAASTALIRAQRDAARIAPSTAKGLLMLQSDEGRPRMTFGFELRLDGAIRIDDVPAGRYAARVDTMKQHAPFPPSDGPGHALEVRAGEITDWVLDFADFGAVLVELLDPASREAYHGWARWTLAAGEPVRKADGEIVLHGADPMTFVRGPYLAGLVPAGTYTLRGHAPRWGSPADEGGYLTIEVVPQEVERVRICLAGD